MTPAAWRLASVILLIAAAMFLGLVAHLGRMLNRERIDYIAFAHITQGRETCSYLTVIAALLSALAYGISLWR